MTEKERAMMEGERNAASDEYFGARPQIDTGDRRRVFEAGFDRAWKAQQNEINRLRELASLAADAVIAAAMLKTPNAEITGG